MNKKKLISLPTAKKLFETAKKFDFELPESEYVHCRENSYHNPGKGKVVKGKWVLIKNDCEELVDHYDEIPAYDDYELGEMLPKGKRERRKKGGKHYYDIQCINISKFKTRWGIDFFKGNQCLQANIEETEVEVKAAMLIYLIENKFV